MQLGIKVDKIHKILIFAEKRFFKRIQNYEKIVKMI